MQRHHSSVWQTALLLVLVSSLRGAAAQAQDPALRPLVDALTPKTEGAALSLTLVRTLSESTGAGSKSAHERQPVRQTIVNEVIAGSNGVRETTFERRKANWGAKENTIVYTNNGKTAKTYDPRNIWKQNRGVVQASADPKTNYLARIVSPDAAFSKRRSLAESRLSFTDRLASAEVESQSRITVDGQDALRIVGHYATDGPEQRFELVTLPGKGYALASCVEYDAGDRVVRAATMSGLQEVNLGGLRLWLPRTVEAIENIFDDVDGNSTRKITLDVVEPTSVPCTPELFDLTFPNEAKVFDAVIGETLPAPGKLLNTTVNEAALQDTPRNIVARVEEAYRKEALTNAQAAAGAPVKARVLQMPRSTWSVVATVAGPVVMALLVARLIFRRFRKQGCTADGPRIEAEGGGV